MPRENVRKVSSCFAEIEVFEPREVRDWAKVAEWETNGRKVVCVRCGERGLPVVAVDGRMFAFPWSSLAACALAVVDGRNMKEV